MPTPSSPSVRVGMAVFLGFLPAGHLKNRLLNLAGAAIATDAHVGPVLFHRVARIRIGERARIGGFSTFRHLDSIEIGADADLGRANRFSGTRTATNSVSARCALEVGAGARLRSGRYVDCVGGVRVFLAQRAADLPVRPGPTDATVLVGGRFAPSRIASIPRSARSVA